MMISDELLADPTNPTGGPEGAVRIINYICERKYEVSW